VTAIDWRKPENRREAFLRFYGFHLKHRTHPGLVYMWLPAIAEAYDLDEDGRAWLTWLNGNTQNPVMSLLLLEAAPSWTDWRQAVAFWNDNFKLMDWDTDRRHQKSKFGEATERWVELHRTVPPSEAWLDAGLIGWDTTWKHATSQPYMGRLSAWSMTEYARILLGAEAIPDAGSFMMSDIKGSMSHRNGALFVFGRDSVYWNAEKYKANPDWVIEANAVAEGLLFEAMVRFKHPDVSRLTMESAFCTYKSWHKPNRRYPNVYTDMAYERLLKAEARFGPRFQLLWDVRARELPDYLLLERTPEDPGLTSLKQNHYLETGEPIMMHREYPDMQSSFNDNVESGAYGLRKDAARWLI